MDGRQVMAKKPKKFDARKCPVGTLVADRDDTGKVVGVWKKLESGWWECIRGMLVGQMVEDADMNQDSMGSKPR